MLKYLIILGIVQMVHPRTFGQFDISQDSIRVEKLRTQLPHLTGIQRVNCLNEISQQYIYFTYTFRRKYADSIIKYTNKAKIEAKKIGYQYGYAISLLDLATIEIYRPSYPKVNSVEALKLIQEALEIGNLTRNNKLLGSVYRTLGEMYVESNDPRRFETLKISLDYYLLTDDAEEISTTAGWLCDEYMLIENYGEALPFCEKCISSCLMKAGIYVAYSNCIKGDALWHLSIINEVAGDYVTALKYLQQADQYAKVVYGDSTMLAETGDLYNRLGQYDSANFYFATFQRKYPQNPFIKIKIGETFLLKKRADKALELFLKAKESVGWLPELSKNLAKAYMAATDFKTALQYLRSWVNYAYSTKTPGDLLEAYQLQAKFYHGVGRNDSAYAYQQKFDRLKDSMSNRQLTWRLNNMLYTQKKAVDDAIKASEIALLQKDILIKDQLFREQALLKDQKEAQIQLLDKDNKIKEQQLVQEGFLKDQKEARIAILNKDNKLLDKNNQIKTQQLKQQSTTKKFLFAILFAFILTGVFIFRNLSLKRKNEKLQRERLENDLKVQELQNEKEQAQLQQQATELEMQALRAQMNPHFIFNCLSSINKYIVKNETVSASDYLTRFSRLIRMVLVNSQKSLIKLEDELDMLKLYLDMERLRFNNSFDYTITFVNAIEPSNVFIPPMLMQPFCENAIWHGFMHKEGNGKLDIAISIQQDSLYCSIKDNGVGREKAEELKNKSTERQKSLGLKITNNRLALLNPQNGDKNFYEMSDIIDKEGRFSGTQVDFRIQYKNFVENVKA